MHANTPDVNLLERIGQGDESALAELYDRYGRLLYSLALRICGDPQTAEEATQNTFLSVWRSATTYDPNKGKVTTWLATIARNRAQDLVRKYKKNTAVAVPDLAVVNGVVEANAVEEDPAELAETAILGMQVRRALESLPEPQRRVIDSVYYGGLTHREAAVALGIPIGTVKTRIRQALERLSTLVGKGGRGNE